MFLKTQIKTDPELVAIFNKAQKLQNRLCWSINPEALRQYNECLFLVAMRSGDLGTMQFLLELGVSANTNSPAAKLLKNYFELENEVYSAWEFPPVLFYAVSTKNIEMARLLVRFGADTSQKCWGYAALDAALHFIPERSLALEFMKLFLNAGVKENSYFLWTQRVAFDMAFESDDEALAILLTKRGVLRHLNLLGNSQGCTPLLLAVTKGWINTVKLLLEAGADICSLRNRAVLQVAIEHRHSDIACLLIEQGADVHLTDWRGRTMLHLAAEASCTAVTRLLLNRDADVDAVDKYHMTPLCLAVNYIQTHIASCFKKFVGAGQPHIDITGDCEALRNCCELLSLLLNYGAKVNYKPYPIIAYDRLPSCVNAKSIEESAKEAIFQPMMLLVRHGADMECKDYVGDTLLHIAIRLYYRPAIELLLSRGANGNVFNSSDATALHYAIRAPTVTANRLELLELLLEKGAMLHMDPGAHNCGFTPFLTCVYEQRDEELIEFMLKYEFNGRVKPDLRDQAKSIIWHLCGKFDKLLLMHLARQGEAIDNGYRTSLSDSQWCFYLHCLSEVHEMRVDVFYADLTVYDVLTRTKSKLVPLTRNKNFIKAFEANNLFIKYPIYAALLNDSIKDAMEYNELTLSAMKALYMIFQCELPYLVYCKILQYLPEISLKRLKRVHLNKT